VEACPEEALELIQGSDNKIKINRESCRLSGNCVRVCPSGAMQFTGYSETVSGIMDEIEKDLVFFQESGGGITLTGGEPLFQPEFALGILKACKEKNLHTAIETSLLCDRKILEAISEYTDFFIVDMKIFDAAKHQFFTGKSNEIIKANFCYLAASGKKTIVRIPMIKNITDTEENISSIKHYVRGISNDIGIEQIKYNPLTENNYRKLGIPFLLQ
jgi:pyruvate formate lyase activating enzyme